MRSRTTGWGVDVKVGGEAPSPGGEKPAPGSSSSSFSGAFGFATPGKTRVWSATSGGDASARATGGGATARATGGRVSSQSSGTNVSTHSGDDMVEGARTVHVPQVSGAALRVRSRNGSVSVRPGGGEEAVIEAVIRAESEERLNDTRISVERLADETLVVEPVWPEGGPRPNEGCRFEVAIDQVRGMEIQTTNGAIEVEGMAGNAELDTENGAITVRSHEGAVRATSSNGAITVEGAGGAVVARTASARIDIAAEGPVEARTSNGAVSAVLGPDNEGPVDVATSNGAISLDLGGAFHGALKLKTSNANIDFNQPGNVQVIKSSATSARLQAGEGGPDSSAKTSNAGVRVRFTG